LVPEFPDEKLKGCALRKVRSNPDPLDDELLGVFIGLLPGARFFSKLIGSKLPSSTRPNV
jgi:hypothetical protein